MGLPGVKRVVDSCAPSDKVASSTDITVLYCSQTVFDRVMAIYGCLEAVCKSCSKNSSVQMERSLAVLWGWLVARSQAVVLSVVALRQGLHHDPWTTIFIYENIFSFFDFCVYCEPNALAGIKLNFFVGRGEVLGEIRIKSEKVISFDPNKWNLCIQPESWTTAACFLEDPYLVWDSSGVVALQWMMWRC